MGNTGTIVPRTGTIPGTCSGRRGFETTGLLSLRGRDTIGAKVMRTLIVAAAAFLVASVSASDLQLPDLLRTSDGRTVTSQSDWQKTRRPELLELFRTNVYGRAPVGRPESLNFHIVDTASSAMDGKATRKLVDVSYHGPRGTGSVRLVVFTPNGARKPAPCFLLICNRSPTNIDPDRVVKSGFWPAEEIVARGYAAAAFYNGDVAPDKYDGFKSGAHRIFEDPEMRKPDSWGTIAAWAWGATRVMDYLVTDPGIDSKRVALVGHSRGGKTALWAGAEDERFAMLVSNESGSTGAALARNKKGERIRDINRGFPHWFCENYKRFNDRDHELPVDQHMLVALSAPRLVYVASAVEDTWSHPENEFLAAVHASPVYELFGSRGVGATKLPALDAPVHSGRIGYHIRSGKHNLTPYDWQQFMTFADQHLKAR